VRARRGSTLDTPSPDTQHGRDTLGRFLKGNIFGKDNPFARHSAALRKAFYDAATPEDLQQIARTLLNAAKGGARVAAQVALRWLLGKPPGPIDPYALLLKAVALEAVHRARQDMYGESADPAETDPEAPVRGEDLSEPVPLLSGR
jgi:hypothetical protein